MLKKLIKKRISHSAEISTLLRGSFDEIEINLSKLREELNANYLDYISFELGTDLDYNDNFELIVYGLRYETDKEYQKRIDKIKRDKSIHKKSVTQRKKLKETLERKLLKKLKKKYE